MEDLKETLEEFDYSWVSFEQIYISELMLIEKDARRHIVSAIEIEKELFGFETLEKLKGNIVINCLKYNGLRKLLAEKIGQINAVTNFDGKGRDDLDIGILITAEKVLRQISENKSKAVRKLAENIKQAFYEIRQLLRKYAKNLDSVDPQLKNNTELVEALQSFEKSWEKGKQFFINPTTCNQLIYFSEIIETVIEKYKDLQEKIESIDTEIFVTLPCFVVLRALDGNDKGICAKYFPVIEQVGNEEQIHFLNTKNKYSLIKVKSQNTFELYNVFEKAILDKEISPEAMKKCQITQEEISQTINSIKRIAIGMQRHFPADWNSLLEVAIGQYSTK